MNAISIVKGIDFFHSFDLNCNVDDGCIDFLANTFVYTLESNCTY